MSKERIRRRALALIFFALLALFLLLTRPSRAPQPAQTVAISAPAPLANNARTESATAPIASEHAETKTLTENNVAFDRFDLWTKQYLAANAEQRAALLKEGETLADARRVELKSVIRSNPEGAWAKALAPATAAQLPASIQNQLEKRVSGRGDILTLVGSSFDGVRPRAQISNTATINGAIYEAHLYGRRARQQTVRNTPLHGLALDNVMAVYADTARLLEPSEYTPEILAGAKDARCPISGKPIAVASLAVASVGGRAVFLCHAGHIVELNDQENAVEDGQVAAEGGNGGGQKPNGVPPTSINDGPQTLLYIRLIFPDQQSDPQSEEACYTMLKDVNDFWVGNSHGRCYFIPTVTPPIMMPRTAAWYAANDGGSAMTLRSDALEAARLAGYNYPSYDNDCIRYSGASGGFGGQAWVGGRGCWLKSSGAGVAAHELGHNMGLWHANYWDVNPDDSIIGPGSHVEYGHVFDTMGSANAGNYYFNGEHQNELNWLPNEFVAHANTSGTYRIFQLDQPQLENGRTYALKVRKDAMREYWGEFRQRFPSNKWLSNGLLMHWSPWLQSAGGVHLLDTTPGTPLARDDAALVLGRTLSDYGAGVHITPVSKNGTTPESLDIVVNLGTFPGNSAPNFSNLTASSTNPPVGTSVTFTATATDPNGDVLAYYWDFGDGQLGGNTIQSATPSMTFAAAGHYNVVCTVTDMKGGTSMRSIVITAGTPTTFRISGTVTTGGTPLPGALVKSGSFTTYTDSVGNYTLGRLPNATYTVSVQDEGYTFATQDVSVGPDKTGINFSGTAIPAITLSVPDAVITEAGENPGTVRFTRTGSTAAAQVVRFMLFKDGNTFSSNPVTSDTDFKTVSPVPTMASSIYSLTIPAGSASLDWVVTPTDDATPEGNETLRVMVFPTAGYVAGPSSEVELEIVDNEGTKGKVFLTAEDSYGSETGGNTASFRISRLGSTSGPLTVLFTNSGGTATSGSDYTALGTSITLNAGEASKLLVVTPINDSAAEGTESVTIYLASNAAYDIDYSRYYASVYIQDDDMNVVTLDTTDANASEAGQDPGVFVISRTGSTANALSVNYSLSGTALNGNDYFNLPGVVTIPAGQTSAAISIIPYNDAIGEPSQTVILTLESDVKYQLGTPYAGTVTIADDGDAPYITVTASDAYALEGSENASFTLFRPKTGATTTVNYTLTGTAVSGSDYTAVAGSVIFASGDTTKTITIAPIDDAINENVETVILTLTPDAAYVINDDEPSATVYIHDNETVEVNVSTETVTLSEGAASTVGFFLNRSSGTGTLTVNYTLTGTATNGSDYTTVPLSATFAAGVTTLDLMIDPTDDALVEGTETVVFTFSDSPNYSVGAANSATLYITDSETPTITVQFGAATSSGGEGTATVNIPVTLSAAAGSNVTVEYTPYGGSAFIGNDYELSPGLLTFTPGQTSKNITLTVLNDTQVENAETVTVRLQNPNVARLGTITQHTYTINDDDSYGLARVGFAAATSSTNETGGTAQVQVVLSSVLAASATVNYAATGGTATGGGSDYTLAAGTLTFAAGDTLKNISVPIVNDASGEITETIVLTMSSPGNAQLSGNNTHTLSILDDDTPNTLPTISNVADRATNEDTNTGAIAFTISDVETAATALVVTATSSNTLLVPNANITLGGSGGSRTVSIAPAPNLNGTTTITLTVTDAQAGSATDTFVLTVTAINDAPTISNITDKGMPPNSVGGPYNFTVGDLETAAGSLTVTGTSSNTTLLPNANIVFGGSNAARTIRLTTPAAAGIGTTTVTVTVSDGSASSSDTFLLTVDPSFAPPTVATAAAISPAPVTSSTAQLSVLGADNGGETALTYSWETTGTPPAPVVFANNDTNVSKNTQVTFSAPGSYTFRVTITDVGGLTVTSSVTGTVESTLTTLTVSPAAPEMITLATQAFTVTGADQFGLPISAGAVTWSVSGGGSIASNGLFTAGLQGGTFTVSATSGSVTGSAAVTITAAPGPQLGSGITIFPNPSLAGETVVFTVTVTGTVPVSYAWDFGDGSTSSSVNALHTFADSGSYVATVTVTDANGATATASATATVNDAGSGGLPPPLDTDGDGVSDANEIGDGSNPNDPTSFTVLPLNIQKLKLSARFDQQNKDSIQFSGVFPNFAQGFNPLGTVMAIDAGGAKASLTLDAKGRGKTSNASVALKLKFAKNKTTKKSSFVGGDVPFKGSLKAGSWADEWADDGLNGASDAKKAPMSVPFQIAFNGRLYGTTVSGFYSAKTGKAGKFQK